MPFCISVKKRPLRAKHRYGGWGYTWRALDLPDFNQENIMKKEVDVCTINFSLYGKMKRILFLSIIFMPGGTRAHFSRHPILRPNGLSFSDENFRLAQDRREMGGGVTGIYWFGWG